MPANFGAADGSCRIQLSMTLYVIVYVLHLVRHRSGLLRNNFDTLFDFSYLIVRESGFLWFGTTLIETGLGEWTIIFIIIIWNIVRSLTES